MIMPKITSVRYFTPQEKPGDPKKPSEKSPPEKPPQKPPKGG